MMGFGAGSFGLGGGGSPIPFLVAANDATDAEKASAFAQCDGVADDVQINATLATAASAKVILSSGTFVLADTIDFTDNNQTLEGQGREITIIDNASVDHGVTITSLNGCTLKGMKIDSINSAAGGTHGVRLESADDCLIEDIWVEEPQLHGITQTDDASSDVTYRRCKVTNADRIVGAAGIIMQSTTRGLIEDCDVTTTNIHGIQLKSGTTGSSRIRIKNNILTDCGGSGPTPSGHGIRLEGAISTIDNVIIEGNEIRNSFSQNISVSASDHVLIQNNILDITQAGSGHDNIQVRDTSTFITISDNEIMNGTDAGINVLTLSSFIKITDNEIHDNTGHGVEMSFVILTSTISGNTIYNNGGAGMSIRLDGILRVSMIDNMVISNGGWGITTTNNGDFELIDSNTVLLNTTGQINNAATGASNILGTNIVA